MAPMNSSRTVLVTGCSSGIGRALAEEFACRGLQVIATARSTESLKELVDLYPNITALPLDVCDDASIERLHAQVSKLSHGKLAYLVNNAGAHYAVPSIEIDIDKVRNVFETNVFGVMRLCKAFSCELIAAKGTIVQIGSVTRAVPVVWQSPYNATKAALSQFTRTLRLELEPFGVNVCEVVTGYVQSNILRDGLQSDPSSLYLPIRNHIAKLKTDGNRNGTDPGRYAKRVAEQVLRTKPPREIWEGTQAWLLRFVTDWLPGWMSHMVWYSVFHLSRLQA